MPSTQAERWLEGLIDVERRAATARARASRSRRSRRSSRASGSPERGLRPIHVAGSKGKGSTALLAEALLRGAGLRVGTFTSPHLARWTERFRIDGREVEGAALAAAVARAAARTSRRSAPRTRRRAPTFFDATTAAALLLFAEARPRRRGARGRPRRAARLDQRRSRPPSTCVTSIELEHTEVLGDTLAAIAAEKAGILKPGVPGRAGRASPTEARSGRAGPRGGARLPGGGARPRLRGRAARERSPSASACASRTARFGVEAWLPLLGAPARRQRGARRGLRAAGAALASARARSRRPRPPRSRRPSCPGAIEVLGRAPLRIADARAHRRLGARAGRGARARSRGAAATSCSRSRRARTSTRSARLLAPCADARHAHARRRA